MELFAVKAGVGGDDGQVHFASRFDFALCLRADFLQRGNEIFALGEPDGNWLGQASVRSARIAFLTLEDRGSFVIDDALAIDALASRGWQVEEVPWRRDVNWREYACVVVRTTWDYQRDPAAFLQAIARIATMTVVWNPLEVIRWNLQKTYLRELALRGVRIIPTRFGHGVPHEELRAPREPQVLKPTVGANADDAFVLDGTRSASELAEVARRFENRDWMLQPFLGSIVSEGEHSLFYFGNRYSHAVVKQPKRGDFRVQEEHGALISRENPAADLRSAADTVIASFHMPLLQARVDLVRLDGGTPALMELELIEPSLYFREDDRAADRFANALIELQQTNGPGPNVRTE